jgi:pimeloyl-ACP methyl ester carboxylesterase
MRFAGFLAVLAVTNASAFAQDPQATAIDETLIAYASTADSVELPDGRSIHFVCMGQGSPTVILTAGLGDWGTSWSTIQPEIAKTTRACAWDRPGFGLSDAAPHPYSVAATTDDLEAALAQSAIAGPYVLVGHSLGGFETMLYADRHPAKVKGMVLVDITVPGQAAMMKRVAPAVAETSDAFSAQLIALVRGCVAELKAGSATSPACELPFSPTYPLGLTQALRAKAQNPVQGEAVASFYENFALSGEQVINPARDYGDMPLIVLTATEVQAAPPGSSAEVIEQMAVYSEAFASEHDGLAALSTRGINARVPGAGHYIHRDKPQVVIDAVEAVVAEARTAAR